MSAFTFFRKEKKKAPEPSAPEETKESPLATHPAKDVRQSALVLERPYLSEKATRLGGLRQYTFVVRGDATKPEVKQEVEASFGVKVEKVRIVNIPGKVKRLGSSEGWVPGLKKAMVTLKEGEKLELG